MTGNGMSALADEFGWPLTSAQTIRRLNGYAPNDGIPGANYDRGDRGASAEQLPIHRQIEAEPGDFSLAEYDEAFCELQIVNLFARLDASNARMLAEHKAGTVGSTPVATPAIANHEAVA